MSEVMLVIIAGELALIAMLLLFWIMRVGIAVSDLLLTTDRVIRQIVDVVSGSLDHLVTVADLFYSRNLRT